MRNHWHQLTECFCPIPIITHSQDVLLAVPRVPEQKTERKEDSRNISKRLEAMNRGSCGPTVLPLSRHWAASRGSKYSMIAAGWLNLNDLWRETGSCSITKWGQEKWKHWLGFSPADWSTSEPEYLWLWSNRKRKKSKTWNYHEKKQGRLPRSLCPWNTPVDPLSALHVTYTDPLNWVTCVLWAYLLSESPPSCSPSLFL